MAVVDDDYRILESLEDLLESAGYRTRLFASAGELLDTSAFTEVDCVISDIGMPSADGFELQRLFRKTRPTVPVILITGREELTTSKYEADRGGRRLFEKPFNAQELLAAIGSELRAASGNK